MRGIVVASVVFLLALSSLARAGESTSSSSTGSEGKSKDAGHAPAAQTLKPLDKIPAPKIGGGADRAGMKAGGRGSMDDGDDEGANDDEGDGDE